MKKLSSYITIAVLCVTLLSMPASVFALTATTTAAVEESGTMATSGADQVVEVTQATKVDYELPYPGMLPDSPLYFLKQVRDWILDKLIMDPVKKAEFYILQADKRIAMGLILNASGKAPLGEQIISKGEKYMNNAVQSLLAMKSQGQTVPAYIVDHLTQALAKHVELLTAEIAKAQDAQKAGLISSLSLVQQIQSDLAKLK